MSDDTDALMRCEQLPGLPRAEPAAQLLMDDWLAVQRERQQTSGIQRAQARAGVERLE
ncbi:MAG: hypothetical protein ACR2ND_15850 [Solirubrobacteraceae bacterium]